ncbi:MAG TPA: membrane protein insertase YidC [Gammaproteobacteria bacterium]|nr:membrane protein insertase YidC [Gammaproteobacteria bacterium]
MIDSRFFSYMLLAFILLLLYQAWQRDYGVHPPVAATSQSIDERTAINDVPAADIAAGGSQPELASVPEDAAAAHQSSITVATDVLAVEIDLQGGTLSRADLLAYPVDLAKPDQPVRLLTDEPEHFHVAQSGLLAGKGRAPDHHALYTAERREYTLADGAQKLDVDLQWQNGEGVTVHKIFHFTAGSYLVDVHYVVENASSTVWRGRLYSQLQRAHSEQRSRLGLNTYTGGVIYTPEKHYEKISFETMSKEALEREAKGGWLAMIQHYFLAAWIPDAESVNTFYTRTVETSVGRRYVLGMSSAVAEAPPAGKVEFHDRLFVGPKIQQIMEKIATGLELTVDYGFLTIIAKPLFYLLRLIHGWVSNWGFAIILLTLLIKLLFYKLSEMSYRSMAKMRRVQPKMVAIRERYAEDRQRQGQAMMELYRKEKINPLGGCLPMLIQIPVFLALYWMLMESVELRQAPFILWIQDLSIKDPYYVLPVIYGISLYFQQKLNPAPLDPVQAKVFTMLPYIFTVMFAFFPAGLVLYWVVNNTLTIVQQWVITRHVLRDEK